MIRPFRDTISVLELTGAEIMEMQKAGFDQDGNDKPYEYLLFTKNGRKFEEKSTYRLAISTGEVPEAMKEQAEAVEISPEHAIKEYITSLGVFGGEDIVW